jgi:uncharacterized membrane protein YkvA (DUF1232 family)
MALLDLPLRAWAKRIRRDALTLWLAARHPRTPWPAKVLAGIVVAYALSPIDLIPDFVPVLGLLDDLLLLPALIWLAVRLVPADVLAACRAEAEQRMAAGAARPISRIGAAVIVLLWLGLAIGLGAVAWSWWRPE